MSHRHYSRVATFISNSNGKTAPTTTRTTKWFLDPAGTSCSRVKRIYQTTLQKIGKWRMENALGCDVKSIEKMNFGCYENENTFWEKVKQILCEN